MRPKTRVNYFQKENYAFNIKELQGGCAFMMRIDLNVGIGRI